MIKKNLQPTYPIQALYDYAPLKVKYKHIICRHQHEKICEKQGRFFTDFNRLGHFVRPLEKQFSHD